MPKTWDCRDPQTLGVTTAAVGMRLGIPSHRSRARCGCNQEGGVDVQAARIAVAVNGVPACVCHPGPDGDPCRENSGVDDVVLAPKTHFARNRDIVNAVDLLIVIPRGYAHQTIGGTWYSHDYAVKQGKPIVVIWPNGEILDGPAPKVKI